jgi:hypothetical protein
MGTVAPLGEPPQVAFPRTHSTHRQCVPYAEGREAVQHRSADLNLSDLAVEGTRKPLLDRRNGVSMSAPATRPRPRP